MQLHQLQPIHKHKKRKIIGRGGKRGTTSGRGTKGQKSRTGANIKPEIYYFIKKIPKLRGYRFKSIGDKPAILNLNELVKYFQDNDKVTPEILVKKDLVDKIKNRIPKIKILGSGDIKIKLTIEGCQISKSAKKKIEAAGGKVLVKNI